MGVADARAMHPGIEVVEADPVAERRLLESLADWCDRYTPLVALDGHDGLFLDISGCAHLFGGEKSLLDDVLSRFFHQGFCVRAAIASTPGAAWAAARVHGRLTVALGEEEDLLAPLPLWALRIEPQTREGLESVGLRTAGAVLSAPRAPLARRFGRGLLLRLDQALGHVEEAVSPRLPVSPLSAERHLAEPVTRVEDIERLVLMLAEPLRAGLEKRGEGARRLQLLLFRVDGVISRIEVGASRPMREARLVQRLFHERLAALESDMDAGYGFDLVRLNVLSSAPFENVQTDLSGKAADEETDVALFADRVRARLGAEAVMEARLVESHLPERAAVLSSLAQPAASPSGRAAAPPAAVAHGARPIRLLRHPEPLDVPATEVPEGAPLQFRWRRVLHRVERAEGPERIAPEWWRREAETATRDYFRVEDAAGHRYWLYRQGLHDGGEAPRWFMHGLFA